METHDADESAPPRAAKIIVNNRNLGFSVDFSNAARLRDRIRRRRSCESGVPQSTSPRSTRSVPTRC
ncbi:MAG: hypothetical protein ACLSVD_14485 [Eggerthellaceae bacterium]